ncbi:hypothetical protein AXF42_Ash016888 [Apostasia shenzhenica]|uniref:tRNA N(3)-methylcytidine methyltransferase n=1 Tax=Apostasia shenzhenica TaxID=1088818 RepID=A0A2H9ZRE6_9ASPA|nr:hypothetical protein AXF42_Ash016888 [Apostasia shenzhenica]
MAEEENQAQYFSRDFSWEELRDKVERNPSLRYHLSPSPSSPHPGDAIADAWRSFHSRHSSGKFFKERRYLLKEFPELIDCDSPICVLEVGCGNGSTALPILRAKPNVFVFACDCSREALERAEEMVSSSNLASVKHQFRTFVHDFSVNRFPDWLLCSSCQNSVRIQSHNKAEIEENGLIWLSDLSFFGAECCIGGIDFVTMIFTLSAVPLQKMPYVIAECISVLKPGGLLLFRDYGLYDMTMLRFPPDQKVGFREYMRSDGTLSYFFSLDSVRSLFLGAGFVELELEYCCVISVNHRMNKKMHRVWVHGKFQKPVHRSLGLSTR